MVEVASRRPSSDEQQLEGLGYKQELPRVMRFWSNWAVGFAFISPIVGLYTVLALNMATAGPMWIWAVAIAGAGQMLVAGVYAQLASKWPVAGGIYQWSRRLLGPKYGWWAGWIYVWALVFTLSLVAYGGGMFLGQLLGIEDPSVGESILLALSIIAAFTAINAAGVQLLRYTVNIGMACELVGSIAIAVALLLVFRTQPVEVVFNTGFLPEGATFGPAFIAAIAIGGWHFLGFDACGSLAEETQDAERLVPKAIMRSIISVAVIAVFAALAFTLAQPDLYAAVNGQVPDPVGTAVASAFGSWAIEPFLAIIVLSFTTCGIAVQGGAVRVIYSLSRDGMFPGSSIWRKVAKYNGSPVYAVLLVGTLSSLAFLFANVLEVLAGVATGGYFLAFAFPVIAMLIVQLRKRWTPGLVNLGKKSIILTIAATIWVVFETINIAIPRNPHLPWYQNWAVEVGLGALIIVGAIYYFTTRPDRKFANNTSGNKK